MEKKYYSLNPSQKAIYIDQLLDVKSPHYNIGGYHIFYGEVNITYLKMAVTAGVHAFDALQQAFETDESGEGISIAMPAGEVRITEMDFSHHPEPSQAAADWMRGRMNTSIDINAGHLFDFAVLKVEKEKYYLLTKFHHLVIDGIGIAIFSRFISDKYNSLLNGEEMPPITNTFRACVDDYFASFDESLYLQDKAYWLKEFERENNEFFDIRYPHAGNVSSDIVIPIKPEILEKCDHLLERYQVNLAQLTMAALNVLFYQSFGWQQVTYGLTSHNRRTKKEKVTLGTFAQIFPFSCAITDPNITVQKLFDNIKAKQRADYRHLNYPIAQINRDLKLFTKNRSQVFDVAVSYNLLDVVASMQDIKSGFYDISTTQEPNPLHFWWRAYGVKQNLELRVDYQLKCFSQADVSLIIDRLFHVFNEFYEKPDASLEDISILPLQEQTKLLHDFNNNTTAYPAGKTLIELFEEQVQRSPGATAIVFNGQQLTYKELDERTNQVAAWLQQKGVGKESLVPLILERGTDMVISILGVLKAGAAYVPIDTTYPQSRIDYMISDLQAEVVITGLDWEEIGQYATLSLTATPGPNSLAYIIYTSGSTGKPKGVMIEHQGLLNHLYAKINDLYINQDSRIAFTASYTFDISVWQMFSALICGGSTYIYDHDTILKPSLLLSEFRRNGITIAEIVPSYLSTIIDLPETKILPQLQYLLVTGEALHAWLVNKWFAVNSNGITLVNAYGPTEASDDICHYFIDQPIVASQVPIGRPVQNTTIYILNSKDQLCPIGVHGELCVAGIGVGRGYLNQPELTGKKFVINPFNHAERMYRTGDLARWLPDGNIEFIGRMDDQVKIRGYRIELGEIEHTILGSGLVQQAVVLAKGDAQKQLVAYVVGEENYTKERLLHILQQHLAEYMIPAMIIALESLPLTANGKIDKAALPDPELKEMQAKDYVAPVTDLEVTITGIWQELLKVPAIGIYDNLFKLGADSIMVIQFASRMNRLGYNMPPQVVFRQQRVADLSAFIVSNTLTENGPLAEQEILTGTSGLLPIQQWYFDFFDDTDINHYNQATILTIPGNISVEKIADISRILLEHHDALRFRYYQTTAGWQQEYGEVKDHLLEEVNLTGIRKEDLHTVIRDKANACQQSLDISKGEVVKMIFFSNSPADAGNYLLIVAHHLVIDGVSWRILNEDIHLLLESARADVPLHRGLLGKKTASYRRWYEELQAYSKSERLLSQQDYWTETVNAYQPLPTDKGAGAPTTTSDSIALKVVLDAAQTQQLFQEVFEVYHTDVNDILLSALSIAVAKYNGHRRLSIGLEGHGREHWVGTADVSHTAGWFTSMYPVVLELPEGSEADYNRAVREIKEQLRSVPDKGMGYGVLKYMQASAALKTAAEPWDIVFNYLGHWEGILDEDALPVGDMVSPAKKMSGKLVLNSATSGGCLILSLQYSTLHFEAGTAQALLDLYLSTLSGIIGHCAGQPNKYGTPSDYGLQEVASIQQLDAFMEEEVGPGMKRYEVVEGLYKLTGLQEGLLFHSLYKTAADADLYIERQELILEEVDPAMLRSSWEHIVANHSILRSAFYADRFKVPVQCVYRAVDLRFEYHEQEPSRESSSSLDLSEAPLLSLQLVRLADNRHKLLWTHHHILLDGWSLPIIILELLSTYERLSAGEPVIPAKTDHYEDYIRYVESRDQHKENAYWSAYVAGIEGSTLLPFIDAAKERNKGGAIYRKQELTIHGAAAANILAYARNHQVTFNTMLQAVWSVLLHKYTGSRDVVFGVTVAGRPADLPGIEQRVGMYINTLPFRSKPDLDDTITDWLLALQSAHQSGQEYQYTPLSKIQQYSGVTEEWFDTLLVYENYPLDWAEIKQHWTLKINEVNIEEHTNYPLTIVAYSSAEQITVQFSYNAGLLEDHIIQRIQQDFEATLAGMVSDEVVLLKDLFNKPADQLQRNTFTVSLEQPGDQLTIQERLQKSFDANAARCAMQYKGKHYTYADIDKRVSGIMYALYNRQIPQGSCVGIYCENRTLVISAMLAVLKSRCLFVMLEPGLPAGRLSSMLAQIDLKAIITDQATRLPEAQHIEWITTAHIDATDYSQPLSVHTYDAADEVYIYFTSGSTGMPKGIVGKNKGLSHFVGWEISTFAIDATFRFSQFTNPGFDVFMRDTLVPLCAGATICIPEEEDLLTGKKVAQWVAANHIQLIHSVPSFFKFFRKEGSKELFSSLKYILLAGEKIIPYELKDWYATVGTGVQLVNIYGPTETTLAKGYYFIRPDDLERGFIPVQAIAGSQFMILDAQLNICAAFETGDIYIRTPYRTAGYLKDKKADASLFIQNPFSAMEGDLIYKTGDLGRLHENGEIEILGRVDNQIKIRGIRIDLDDVKANILAYPGVNDAAFISKQDEEGETYIYAFIVADQQVVIAALRAHLGNLLPRNMIPAYFIPLEKIPLLPNGKTDRKALAAYPVPEEKSYETPLNDIESKLVNIWSSILKIEKTQVDINRGFFEAGGHSLKVFHLINEIQETFKVKLKLGDIFQHASVKKLADLIAATATVKSMHIERVGNKAYYLASPAQERMYYQHALHQENTALNITLPFLLDESMDITTLKDALQALVNRHEGLRTSFYLQEEGMVQKISDHLELSIATLPQGNMKTALARFIQPFDLSVPPLIRCGLLKDEQGMNILLMDIHHIIADGASLEILMRDLQKLRSHQVLPPLPVRYVDYAYWVQQVKGGLEKQQQYWKNKLAGELPQLELPVAGNVTELHQYSCSVSILSIPGDSYSQLKKLGATLEVSDFMLLLSVYYIVLSKMSGSEDIIIGTDVVGRTHPDLKDVVGTFVNVLPLRVSVDAQTPYRDFLSTVKTVVLEAYENQDLQFDQIVGMLGEQARSSRNPVFDVHFAYSAIGEEMDLASLAGLQYIAIDKKDYVISQYSFKLEAFAYADSIQISFVYDHTLYESDTIELLKGYFYNILLSVLQDPFLLIGDVNLEAPVVSLLDK